MALRIHESVARGEIDNRVKNIVRGKRALDHLHQSQAGFEAVAPKELLPKEMAADARKELLDIREGTL